MDKHLFNVPPLKGTTPKRLRHSISDLDLKLYSMELQAMGWEHGTTEHSKTWGTMLTDLTRTVNTFRKCLSKT